METLIYIVKNNKFLIDTVVLVFLLLLQWDILLLDYLTEKRKDVEFSSLTPDNLIAGMFFLLGLYSFSYHVIEKTISVHEIKGNLSIFGKFFFLFALTDYAFTVWLFISLTAYLLIITFSEKPEKHF